MPVIMIVLFIYIHVHVYKVYAGKNVNREEGGEGFSTKEDGDFN